MTLLVAGVALLVAAAWLTVRPWRVPGALPAYLGLCLLHCSTLTTFPTWVFWFYAVATVIVMALTRLQPDGEPDGRRTGSLYIGLGAMAGCLLGMLLGARFMMLGTVIGGAVGELAFARTPHGKWLKFSYSDFLQYFCARVLPAIVTVAMLGVAVEGFVYDI